LKIIQRHEVVALLGVAQRYFDPDAAPITGADASWAVTKATAVVSGVSELLASSSPPGRFD
jgi:hypothetical protein